MIFNRWILKVHLPQNAPSFIDSSLLSPQSLWELHTSHFWIHFPLLHWNRSVFSHVPGFPEIETHKLLILNSRKECWHTLLWQNFYWYWHIFDINFQSFIHDIFNQHKNEKKRNKTKWYLNIPCFIFQFSTRLFLIFSWFLKQY